MIAVWLIGLPAFAAWLGAVASIARLPRSVAAGIAVTGATLAWWLSILLAIMPRLGGTWRGPDIPTGGPPITLTLQPDRSAALVAVLVTTVALLVQVYSTGYLRLESQAHQQPERYPSYAAIVSLFSAAMLLVVLAGDVILLFVGWEVMGACSYLLIGYGWQHRVARAAAVKAFLVTRVGDVALLAGLLILATHAGTFQLEPVLASVPTLSPTMATVTALLVLAGIAGKSAQFPLHIWLPDAMAGPTPVSALIHAATMVAAGIYLGARLFPLLDASPTALLVCAVMAAITMVGAALIALAQDDLKRVLAYSTISQLGVMAGALAVADPNMSLFHLVSHGGFKALLFLTAGALMMLTGTGALSEMGQRWRRSRPSSSAPPARSSEATPVSAPVSATRPTLDRWVVPVALIGGLAALSGIPPFSGFFSKEAVFAAAEHAALEEHLSAGWIVLVAGLATTLLTAVYSTRVALLALRGPRREASTTGGEAAQEGTRDENHRVDVLPAVMRWPLLVLLVPATLLGVLALPFQAVHAPGESGWGVPALAVGLALLGVGIGVLAWYHLPSSDLARLYGPLRGIARRGFGVDRAAHALAVVPVRAAARAVEFIDRTLIEEYVRDAGRATAGLGGWVRRLHTSNVQTYLTFAVIGVLGLAVWVVT